MGTAKIQGDLWGKAAHDWATIQEPPSKPLWEAMLDGALVGEGSRILDVGCGAGGASELAATRGAKVSGLDAAQGLIDFAGQRLPECDFRVGDMESLPVQLSRF